MRLLAMLMSMTILLPLFQLFLNGIFNAAAGLSVFSGPRSAGGLSSRLFYNKSAELCW